MEEIKDKMYIIKKKKEPITDEGNEILFYFLKKEKDLADMSSWEAFFESSLYMYDRYYIMDFNE